MSEREEKDFLITYNRMGDFLRVEKSDKGLKNVPESFYEKLSEFMENKKKEILELKQKGDKLKVKKNLLVLKQARKIVYELLNLRLLKVSEMAIKNEIFSEVKNTIKSPQLERNFYEVVKQETGKVLMEAVKK